MRHNVLKFFNFFHHQAFKSPLILIVDDNPVDRELIGQILKKEYRCVTSENGQDSVAKALALKPNLILMDCHMPKMNGMEACQELSRHEATKHIPVIFLTGNDVAENVFGCFDTTARLYLTKPIIPRLLRDKIAQTLAGHAPNNRAI
ncbi:MAG: response regulator [Candidatus Omnitrophica bacterium]|nr:response regulator [Candidatus Omnitrophota bacterium]